MFTVCVVESYARRLRLVLISPLTKLWTLLFCYMVVFVSSIFCLTHSFLGGFVCLFVWFCCCCCFVLFCGFSGLPTHISVFCFVFLPYPHIYLLLFSVFYRTHQFICLLCFFFFVCFFVLFVFCLVFIFITLFSPYHQQKSGCD